MRLNRLLTFCCKVIQGLNWRCRSDICTALVGMNRMQAIIDMKKLNFMSRLIWLPDHLLAKRVFNARLLQHVVYAVSNTGEWQTGFIADIVNILGSH